MSEGIDVHGSKGPVDWKRVRESGREFAFVKATEGASYVDQRIAQNLLDADRAGLKVGPYHFARPDLRNHYGGGVTEAKFFLRVIREAGYSVKHHMLPVLDIEADNTPGPVDEFIFGFSDTVLNELGVFPIIYTYPYYARAYITSAPLSRHPLWIADYGDNDDQRESAPRPIPVWGTSWVVHQYSSNGSVPGVDGRCDLNYAPSVEVLLATPPDTRDWPRPIPMWFWEWARWRLQGRSYPRPSTAPRLIPLWAWRRLRALIAARR